MTGRRRPKSVRKARALAVAREERLYSKEPHSFVFARPGVGNLVKQLSLDIRRVFEPNTATRLKAHRGNVLKDFVAVAGPLNVSHLLYLTHPHADKRNEKRARQLAKKAMKKSGISQPQFEEIKSLHDRDLSSPDHPTGGGVYLHLVRAPHGPSLTFSVVEYSLQRDVLTLVRRIFNSHQYSTPPLLAMTGFGSLNPNTESPKQPQPPPPHLRLVVDMFQNMLPSLNVQKLKLSTVRRVLLISREVDLSTSADSTNPDDVIYVRHYHIRTENRNVSRALRRLSVGGTRLKKRKLLNPTVNGMPLNPGLGPGGSGKSSNVPNLSKYSCIEDFVTKSGMLSDSGLSDALSDMEEVELPASVSLPSSVPGSLGGSAKSRKRKFVPSHGLRHLGTAKTASIRLTEIGPRLTLRLIKVEEGLNTGAVLYHRWQSRSLAEVVNQSERLRQREALRSKRRAEHEARRAAKEAAREAHRTACIEGMRRAGQLPVETSSHGESSASENDAVDSDSDKHVNVTKKSTISLDKGQKARKQKPKRSFVAARRSNPAKIKTRTFPLNDANEGNASKSSHPDGYQISKIDSVRPSTGAIDIAKTLLRLLKWDELFDYMEIYPGSKVKHFERLTETRGLRLPDEPQEGRNRSWAVEEFSATLLTGIPYNEMIFFDDEERNIRDVSQLGVHSYLVDNGMTVSLFHEALNRFERATGLQ